MAGADRSAHAADGGGDPRPAVGELAQSLFVLRAVDGAVQHGVGATEHGVHPAAMVQVEVREDEQVDPFDPQLPQTVRERLGVGTGVDQQHRIA